MDKTFVRLLAHEKQRRKKSLAAIASVLLILVWPLGWYVIAADYSYKALAGAYTLKMNNASSTLVLKEDQTFEQTLDEHSMHKSSHGTWRRIGEGGIVFSNSFLATQGQDNVANGEVYGNVEKAFGLFVSIRIDNNPNQAVYHKHYLS